MAKEMTPQAASADEEKQRIRDEKKKLKKNKKYYFKVRAYKTAEGKKYYSAYSKVKAVKVK